MKGSGVVSDAMPDNAANKAVVVDFLATFSRGDVAGLMERMDEDATWWVSGTIEGLSDTYDKQALTTLLGGIKDVYRQGALRITPLSMIAEGDKVAVEAESYAELNNGRIYNNFYHFLFELKGGRVLRVREYMDTMHAQAIFFGV